MKFKVDQWPKNRGVPNPGYWKNKDRLVVTLIWVILSQLRNPWQSVLDIQMSWQPVLGIQMNWQAKARSRATSDYLCAVKFGTTKQSSLVLFLHISAEISDPDFWSLIDLEFHPIVFLISYRADTPIPATFVAIRVAKKIPVASLGLL